MYTDGLASSPREQAPFSRKSHYFQHVIDAFCQLEGAADPLVRPDADAAWRPRFYGSYVAKMSEVRRL